MQAIGFFVVVPWAVVVGLAVEAARGAADLSTVSVVELTLIPLLAVVGLGTLPLSISRGSRVIGGHHKFEFTDKDFHLAGPGIDSRLQWSGLTRCFGRKHGIPSYSGNQPMISIPGRTLAPDAVAELRTMSSASSSSHGFRTTVGC